jgi:hypothetical protein
MNTLLRSTAALLLTVAATASSGQIITSRALRARALAEGCVASTLSCGATESGQLAPGDCTFTVDGTRYDVWHFNGTAGQLVTVTVKPLDASYTKPQVELVPPLGDASQTPTVAGTSPLSLSYNLASTGVWSVAVETNDVFAAGHYSISLACGNPIPGDPQNCVAQSLSCGQSYDWSVTASSCQFTGGGHAYAPFSMRMAKGDYVKFSAHSDAYDPAVGVYRNGGAPLIYNNGVRSKTDAVVFFTAPETAIYQIDVYGAAAQSAGEFVMSASCLAVCSAPSVTSQPASQSIPFAGTAVVSVAATSPNGNAPSFEWRDADDIFNTLGLGSSLTLSNVTRRTRVYAHVVNACGSVDSAIAIITPAAPPRGRAARH